MATKNGISVYDSEFLSSPAALECSLSWCSHDCSYCFANLNAPDRQADLGQITGLLANFRERKTREALLLQAGYPMLLSNRVDPFAGSNARYTEPIWELCMELGIPLTWQTRGAHKPQQKLLDRIIENSPPASWYVSITTLDDEVRQRIEPRAPSIPYRLELVRQLAEAGHLVHIGMNPLHHGWNSNPEATLEAVYEAGAFGVWMEALYLGSELEGRMPQWSRDAIGRETIDRVGRHGSPTDRALLQQSIAYAREIGLEPFSLEIEGPTDFFTPWYDLYPNTLPHWMEVINVVDSLLEEGDDEGYVIITKNEARSLLSEIPNIEWSRLLHKRRSKRYREIMPPTPDGSLPKCDRDQMFDIIWNDEKFANRLGLSRFHRCAFASVIQDKIITPIVDENGDRIIVYRRNGFRYTYAHTPELAA